MVLGMQKGGFSMERFLPGTTLGLDDEGGSPEMRIKSLFLAED